MSREAHVRFWEGVGVKLPRATHFVVLNETHLRRLLRGYVTYYHAVRPHQALDHNSPRPRAVQPPALGRVVATPQLGGLHHLYQRAA